MLIIFLFFFSVCAIVSLITLNKAGYWVLMFLLYLFVFRIFSAFFIKKLNDNENSYGIGYMVEEIVGTKLAALGEEYKVIHSVLKHSSRGNIDHIVVGPTGIFVIESKSNRNWMFAFKNGDLIATGLATKFIKQAARNSVWTHDQINKDLGINKFVHGVVVRPLNSNRKIQTHCVNDVCILDGDVVYTHIKNFNDSLSKEEVEKVYRYLCQIKRKNEDKYLNFIQKKLISVNLL